MIIRSIHCKTCAADSGPMGAGNLAPGKTVDTCLAGRQMRMACKETGCKLEMREEEREPTDIEALAWGLRPDAPLVAKT